MDHFVDIELRADPEFAAHQLMSALYSKLHRALVKLSSNTIGASFPEYDDSVPHLGNRLRLHGTSDALATLMQTDWLLGVRDHVMAGPVRPVPAGAGYRIVRRVQAKSSPERMRRRLQRRHDLSDEEALERIPSSAAKFLQLPFVHLTSASTEQKFRLLIAHAPVQKKAVEGVFNAYALSPTATIPWF